jgi:hypothetical protein
MLNACGVLGSAPLTVWVLSAPAVHTVSVSKKTIPKTKTGLIRQNDCLSFPTTTLMLCLMLYHSMGWHLNEVAPTTQQRSILWWEMWWSWASVAPFVTRFIRDMDSNHECNVTWHSKTPTPCLHNKTRYHFPTATTYYYRLNILLVVWYRVSDSVSLLAGRKCYSVLLL